MSLGTIADGIGILGAIFALLSWVWGMWIKHDMKKEHERQNRWVEVVLQSGRRKIRHPLLRIRRKELTRAEILGRLGALPLKTDEQGKKSRFNIPALSTEEFLKTFYQVLDGQGDDTLVISCKEEELDQFDLPSETG